MVICHGRSFTNFPNIFGIAGEMKFDQIPQLLPKKELVLEKVNTWNPLNIFVKSSDVCRSAESFLSFNFETRL